MPPRALAGEDLSSHQPISSVQIDPQRGCAIWLYSAAHLTTENSESEGPIERERRGSRIEWAEKRNRKEEGERSLWLCDHLIPFNACFLRCARPWVGGCGAYKGD